MVLFILTVAAVAYLVLALLGISDSARRRCLCGAVRYRLGAKPNFVYSATALIVRGKVARRS